MREIIERIESCTGYEKLAQLCYAWASSVGIDLEQENGTYTQLARWYEGTPEGEIFEAFKAKSEVL